MERILKNIHWLGHASFRVEAMGMTIYIDPWQLKDTPPADVILVTHEHQDHCSPEDIASIRNEDTVIAAPKAAAAKIGGDVEIVEPGMTLSIKGIPIKALAAYNTNKFRSPGNPFHPKEAGHVGYVFSVEGVCLYHTGDSDLTEEMKTVNTDIAMMPVSGTYVMTAEEAAEAVSQFKVKTAIPMHVGRGIGDLEMTETFKSLASCDVVILPMEG